jgi:hypothetical protein
MTTKREMKDEFSRPDDSAIGGRLQRAAVLLGLLEDIVIGNVGAGAGVEMGLTEEDSVNDLTMAVIGKASEQLVEAREALHALFEQVQLKPDAPGRKGASS